MPVIKRAFKGKLNGEMKFITDPQRSGSLSVPLVMSRTPNRQSECRFCFAVTPNCFSKALAHSSEASASSVQYNKIFHQQKSRTQMY